MHKLLIAIAFFAIGAFLVSTVVTAAPSKKAQAPNLEWVEETFIDYTHAGPGPHPTSESDNFHLTQGGIKWFAGGAVEYRIIGTEDTAGGNAAIEAAEAIIDGFVTTRTLSRNDGTTQTNPCTEDPNTVQWTTIDGPDGALASASVCRNVVTKAIGGFVVTIDIDEPWSTTGSLSAFDVENALVHEWLHVGGLDHTNAPQDGCLTSYRLAGLGETQKRTLGLGDKLGMDALYSTGDTTGGPGCAL